MRSTSSAIHRIPSRAKQGATDPRHEDALALVDALRALQTVESRSDFVSWAHVHLNAHIALKSMACLLAEPHRRGFRIRDVIASDDVADCVESLEDTDAVRCARTEAVQKRHTAIVDASRALIDHWMRDRWALQMGLKATRAQESEPRAGPLLACFDVDAIVMHGVKEAFSGSATFLVLGVTDGNAATPATLDVLNLLMPAIHIARQRIHRTERSQSGSPTTVGLTPREVKILSLIAEGCTDEEAARNVGRSVHTIKNQVRHLVTKLGARNRTQAVLFAQKHDLLPLEAASIVGIPLAADDQGNI